MAGVVSSCWSAAFTFERCCAGWRVEDVGVGNTECWVTGLTYERCCVPSLGAPRDIFACRDAAPAWSDLRRVIGFANPLGDRPLKAFHLDVKECLLGALAAAMATALHLSYDDRHGKAMSAYSKADWLLRVVMRSSVSLEELVSCGWGLFTMMFSLVRSPSSAEKFGLRSPYHKSVALLAYPSLHRVGAMLAPAMHAGVHVPLDQVLAAGLAAAQESQAATSTDEQQSVMFAQIGALWAAAYSLWGWYIPAQLQGQGGPAEAEAAGLLEQGWERLRHSQQWRIDFASEGSDADSGLLRAVATMPAQPLDMLVWMGNAPVVQVDAISLLCRTSRTDNSLPVHFCPSWWRSSGKVAQRTRTLLSLHLLPKWDSVSNAVRTTRKPLCTVSAFVQLIAGLSRIANSRRSAWRQQRPLRIWEVGANLGDCTLAAAAILRSGPCPRRLVGALFEPTGDTAAAARRSVMTSGLDQQLQVFELALGREPRPRRKIHVPRGYSAEATFVDDATAPHWQEVAAAWSAPMETIDRLLCDNSTLGAIACSQGGPPVLDVLKIHVQGYELEVLKGGAQALAAGLICMVLFPVPAGTAMQHESSAGDVRRLLSNFTVVTTFGDSGLEVESGTKWWQLADESGQQKPRATIVAWRRALGCRGSPSVRAAEWLWGGAAEPLSTEQDKLRCQPLASAHGASHVLGTDKCSSPPNSNDAQQPQLAR
mmetsp:Transcript_87424/g.280443  ORF Transcript_87424/g.280443 Transcript_87424/m.280443 type:complete len:708 (+) Transcript_87424:61-2184(+)